MKRRHTVTLGNVEFGILSNQLPHLFEIALHRRISQWGLRRDERSLPGPPQERGETSDEQTCRYRQCHHWFQLNFEFTRTVTNTVDVDTHATQHCQQSIRHRCPVRTQQMLITF